MASLHAPRPRRLFLEPAIVDLDGHAPLSPHGIPSQLGHIVRPQDDPFVPQLSKQKENPSSKSDLVFLLPPPRISSKRPKYISKSPTPCSSITTPLSQHASVPRSPRRRRHAHHTRATCGFSPRNPSVFDTLPWISALDAEPTDIWALGDLSELPVNDRRVPGPIRRRKTSATHADAVRSLGLEASARPKISVTPAQSGTPAPLVAPARDVMSTPPPRFPSASHVEFHNLMPVWTPRATA